MWRVAIRRSIPHSSQRWFTPALAVGVVSIAAVIRRNEQEDVLHAGAVCEGQMVMSPEAQQPRMPSRSKTLDMLSAFNSEEPLSDKYDVDWDAEPLGVGSFGSVHMAIDKKTGEQVALKRISKDMTDDKAFEREINALLHLRKAGGHPYIAALRENFSDGDHYYLVLDLVRGGEMFDHLVEQGAYSEMEASRLIREVASALAFLHGLGTTHGDLKPENLMLSTSNPSDCVIKLVDFGCALVEEEERLFDYNCAVVDGEEDDDSGGGMDDDNRRRPEDEGIGFTVAYCPPEVLEAERPRISPAMDMWALGVILYIMLTGSHPFDLRGEATDDEIEQLILSGKKPPLRNSSITAHLSGSAIDLIEGLLQPDPKKRLTALEMLEHPWVKGLTASHYVMAGSSKKLSHYRAFKTKISAKVFEHIIHWSDHVGDNVSKRVSLIERSFRAFDSSQSGFITKESVQELIPDAKPVEEPSRGFFFSSRNDSSNLSLAGFSDLLAENMKNEYFPKRHVVYKEGEEGNYMYFINSGTVSVETEAGSVSTRGPGDFFGEGALLSESKLRSATIRCVTPVHAIVISREYFDKYLASSDSNLTLILREKDNVRKRNRAKSILRLQKNLKEMSYRKDQAVFETGQKGDFLFLVEEGNVDVLLNGSTVFSATPGNIFGEYAPLTGRRRNVTAVCGSENGCKVQKMMGKDFRNLLSESAEMSQSLRDLSIRRGFKKAVVNRLQKEFPYNNPREAFDALRTEKCSKDELCYDAIVRVVREFNPKFTKEEADELMKTLDLSHSGTVTYEEFKKVFIANKQTSSAI